MRLLAPASAVRFGQRLERLHGVEARRHEVNLGGSRVDDGRDLIGGVAVVAQVAAQPIVDEVLEGSLRGLHRGHAARTPRTRG